MKAMLRSVVDKELRYQCIAFVCPGCETLAKGFGLHMLPVNTEVKSPSWNWDGNLENPTISPSIKTESKYQGKHFICHGYLEGGRFRFLEDSTHELAGQTNLIMQDLPEWFTHETENTMTEEVTETTEVPDSGTADTSTPEEAVAGAVEPAQDGGTVGTDGPAESVPDAGTVAEPTQEGTPA